MKAGLVVSFVELLYSLLQEADFYILGRRPRLEGYGMSAILEHGRDELDKTEGIYMKV